MSKLSVLRKKNDKLYLVLFQILSAVTAVGIGKVLATFFPPDIYGLYNLQFATVLLFTSIFISPLLQFIKTHNNTLNKKIGTNIYNKILLFLTFLSFCLILISFNFLDFNISEILFCTILLYIILDAIFKIKLNIAQTSNYLITYGLLEALQKIFQVCKNTPDINHWLPTREYGVLKYVEQKDIPDNLIIRASAIKVNGNPPKFWQWTSTVHTKGKKHIGKKCPAINQDGQCLDCRNCWKRSIKNISYEQH